MGGPVLHSNAAFIEDSGRPVLHINAAFIEDCGRPVDARTAAGTPVKTVRPQHGHGPGFSHPHRTPAPRVRRGDVDDHVHPALFLALPKVQVDLLLLSACSGHVTGVPAVVGGRGGGGGGLGVSQHSGAVHQQGLTRVTFAEVGRDDVVDGPVLHVAVDGLVELRPELHAVRVKGGHTPGRREHVPEEERDEAPCHGGQELVGRRHAVRIPEGHDDDEDEEEEEEDAAEAPEGSDEVHVERARRAAVVEHDGVVEELLRRVGRVQAVQEHQHAGGAPHRLAVLHDQSATPATSSLIKPHRL